MASAAFTVKVFGVYIIATGVTLLLVPNVLLGLFGIPEAKEVWIRLLGAVAVVLGYYYYVCAGAKVRVFFSASVYGRLFFCAIAVALFLLAEAPWALLVFGAVDLAGAAWTSAALRSEAKAT